MITVGVVRTTALLICALGVAGMIVTSILNHNGAAVTFGLITTVAILCSMVAKAVATSTELRLAGSAPNQPTAPTPTQAKAPPAARGNPPEGAEPIAAEVERRLQVVVAAGADESAVRELVGEAVRLGRALGVGKGGRG